MTYPPEDWKNDLLSKLTAKAKNNEFDLRVSYKDISNAFPAGPHSDYDHLNAIDWSALVNWAKKNGWTAKADPEFTVPEQQSTPWIRFTKIGYEPKESLLSHSF